MKQLCLAGLGLLLGSLLYGAGTSDTGTQEAPVPPSTVTPIKPEDTRPEALVVPVPEAFPPEEQAEDAPAVPVLVPEHLVWVAGGVFQRGNPHGEDDEKPVQEVRIRSFMIGKTEVTQKEYEALMRDNPSRFKGDALPVEGVTWYDAVEYCNLLSQKEGLTPVYQGSPDQIYADPTANGYRLPTEAEWEYAARDGQFAPGFTYPGGDEPEPLAWYSENSDNRTHDVAGKVPNRLGLYDMAGNVWEWCWDWYEGYGTEVPVVFSDPVRVIRGGSCHSAAACLRSTYRHAGDPSQGYFDLGFRVLRSAE